MATALTAVLRFRVVGDSHNIGVASKTTISAISPSIGSVLGGAIVTITGTDFDGGNTRLQIGGTVCGTVTVLSETSLTCITPAHTPGKVDVEVTVGHKGRKVTGHLFPDIGLISQ